MQATVLKVGVTSCVPCTENLEGKPERNEDCNCQSCHGHEKQGKPETLSDPGRRGRRGADRERRALSAEPAGRAVTLRSAGWAWQLLTRAEAGGRCGACVACGFSVNLNCPQVRRLLGRPVSCYSAVSLRAFLSTSITELFTRKTWEPPERPSGRLSFLCVFPPCLF